MNNGNNDARARQSVVHRRTVPHPDRFSEKQIAGLQSTRWWDLPEDRLPDVYTEDVDGFLRLLCSTTVVQSARGREGDQRLPGDELRQLDLERRVQAGDLEVFRQDEEALPSQHVSLEHERQHAVAFEALDLPQRE